MPFEEAAKRCPTLVACVRKSGQLERESTSVVSQTADTASVS